MAKGAYVRLQDASGDRTTIGGNFPSLLVVTNERVIWLREAYLFWSLKNIKLLTPVTRGDLRFEMTDGSKVQIALGLWLLNRTKIESVNKTLEALKLTHS